MRLYMHLRSFPEHKKKETSKGIKPSGNSELVSPPIEVYELYVMATKRLGCGVYGLESTGPPYLQPIKIFYKRFRPIEADM